MVAPEGTWIKDGSASPDSTSAPFSFALLVCGIGLSSLALGWSSATAAGPQEPPRALGEALVPAAGARAPHPETSRRRRRPGRVIPGGGDAPGGGVRRELGRTTTTGREGKHHELSHSWICTSIRRAELAWPHGRQSWTVYTGQAPRRACGG